VSWDIDMIRLFSRLSIAVDSRQPSLLNAHLLTHAHQLAMKETKKKRRKHQLLMSGIVSSSYYLASQSTLGPFNKLFVGFVVLRENTADTDDESDSLLIICALLSRYPRRNLTMPPRLGLYCSASSEDGSASLL
jgi:hypothetical protein